MAITGLLMVGFLLMHMYGNLKAFLGPESFDHYAEWLKSDILYPIVPEGWFIWIFRFVMVAAIILHVWSAASLWRISRAAEGSKYVDKKRLNQTYSARTMRWGGIILLGFLIFHLLQFTAKAVTTGFNTESTPYEMVVLSFQQWWLVLAYALWLVAVCMHVRHGFWSAFTTLGANMSAKSRKILNALAIFVAVLLYVGFMIMPIAVLFGGITL